MNFPRLLLGGLLLPLGLLAASDQRVTCTSAQPYRGLALRSPVSLPPPLELAPPVTMPFAPELAENLAAALALAQTKSRAPAITAAVAVSGRGSWTATRTLDPAAVPPPLFYWGSAGKTFTAVLIFQLIEEGKLTLATPIAQWFPDYPNAKVITIDHLLTHTSGIFSFNEDLKHRKQPGYKSPTTLLATAKNTAMAFVPVKPGPTPTPVISCSASSSKNSTVAPMPNPWRRAFSGAWAWYTPGRSTPPRRSMTSLPRTRRKRRKPKRVSPSPRPSGPAALPLRRKTWCASGRAC